MNESLLEHFSTWVQECRRTVTLHVVNRDVRLLAPCAFTCAMHLSIPHKRFYSTTFV